MDKTLFFILGSGRMGSTFLHRVLKEHPSVALTNEARVIDALHVAYNAVVVPYGERSHLGFEGLIRDDVRPAFVPIFLDHVRQMLLEYYEKEFGGGFTHFGEKMPGVVAAGELSKLWPGTRTIVLLRDPRDVVCSFRALQRVPDPTVLGRRWRGFLEKTTEDFAREWRTVYQDVLDHIEDRILVRYESLMLDPEATVARTLDYLGLDQDPAVTAAIGAGRATDGHGTSKTFEQSLGRWRQDLPEDEAATVTSICRPLMERLGLTV